MEALTNFLLLSSDAPVWLKVFVDASLKGAFILAGAGLVSLAPHGAQVIHPPRTRALVPSGAL